MEYLVMPLQTNSGSTPGLNPHHVFVMAAVHSGLVIAVVGDRVQLVTRSWKEEPNQQWRFESGPDGFYFLRNIGTNLVMDLFEIRQDNGAPVVAHGWNGGPNQQFRVIDQQNGRFSLQFRHSNKVLDVLGFNRSEGAGIVQWDLVNGPNQQWQLSVVKRISDLTLVTSLKATVWEFSNFQGRSRRLGLGPWSRVDLHFEDQPIKSIQVPKGIIAHLEYHDSDTGSGGRRIPFDSDAEGLSGNPNYDTDSLYVEPAVTVFNFDNFEGPSRALGVGQQNRELIGGIDQISSVKVPAGMVMTLYERPNYQGRVKTLIEDAPVIEREFRNGSIAIQVLGVRIPEGALTYGSEISLRSAHGLFMVAEDHDALNANRSMVGPWEQFTVVRSGPTSYTGFVAYGDTISLRSAHGKFVVALPDGTARADRAAIGPWEQFVVIRSGDGRQNDIVSRGDIITLRSVHQRFVVALPEGNVAADRPAIGPWERWTIETVVPSPAAVATTQQGGNPCGAEACVEDHCGAAACGAAAGGVGACGAAACGAAACGLDACSAAACGAASALASTCAVAASPLAVCAADICGAAAAGAGACGAAACGAAVSVVAVCGADACGAAACAAAATGIGASASGACAADAKGIDLCQADACAANACGVNLCPADACAADACGIDIIPLIPGI